MSHQPKIGDLFSKKKLNATKQAFEQQYAEINQSRIKIAEKEDCCNHIEEVKKLNREKEEHRSTNHVLENQLKAMTEKYEKLKVKHISLLQTLLMKENEIKKLKLKSSGDEKHRLLPDLLGEPEPQLQNVILFFNVFNLKCIFNSNQLNCVARQLSMHK